MNGQKIKVGITVGDPNGVGCEVLLKVLADNRICDLFTPVIYASAKVIAHYRKLCDLPETIQCNVIATGSEARPKRINLINCIDDNLKIEPGTASAEAGKAAVEALFCAAKELREGRIDVLVTGPINKETVQAENFKYHGHTEFLADYFEGMPTMMMCSELMKIALVTTHVPIKNISDCITQEQIVRILATLRQTLIQDFEIIEPRIAVLGLNPHAGDGGLLGDEEIETISPAIRQAFDEGTLAFGPFPADGFFAAGTYGRYDAVLAMYHDQGLAPFKALTPQGVNFTSGLNIIRTSPDHGVAYDIAGKGIADETSMREAIFLAIDIFRKRKHYSVITSNPLKHFERERGKDMSINDLPSQADEI